MIVRALLLFLLLVPAAVPAHADEDGALLPIDEAALEEHLSKPFEQLDFKKEYSKAESAMQAFNTVTGLALSPALGAGAVSAWRWWKTPKSERASLPFYLRPWFFSLLLFVSLLFLFNGWLGSFFPLLEKPMQMVEQVETRVSALLACPLLMDVIWELLGKNDLLAGVLPAGVVAAGIPAPAEAVLTAGFLVFAFVSVLLFTLATNVILLISPFAAVDSLVRNGRALFLLGLVGASLLHPALGALLSGALLLVSVFLLRWTWRIARYGITAVGDVLFRRSARMRVIQLPLVGFGCRGLGKHARFAEIKVTVKPDGTYFLKHGKVRRKEPTTTNFILIKGLTRLWLAKMGDPADPSTIRRLVELPLRYAGHEEEIARLFNCPIEETATRAGIRGALAWIKNAFNGDFQNV